MKTFIFIFLQYIVPQHLISRAIGRLAATDRPAIKSRLIKQFISTFKVDMSEAENSDPSSYATFNDFFCRALKDGARPICEEKSAIVSPADGVVSQAGPIKKGRIFQAKGRAYNAHELLGANEAQCEAFANGSFATIYLSPKDYHRLHMPVDGKLVSMTYVPGNLFSVNPSTTDNVPRLFARNERVVCLFDTEIGPMALVLVGAMIVASIETVWAGQVAPLERKISTRDYTQNDPIYLKKGEEMGRFKLGSTIVVLFPENRMDWKEELVAEAEVKMGQAIGELR